MKFLVIGASGFLGREVLYYAKAMSYQAIGTKNKSKDPSLIIFDLLKHRIEECINLSFFRTCQKVFVVICAALSQIDRCLMEKNTSYKINVEKTIQLINDVRRLRAIPVFISTSAVYSGDAGPYNEDHIHGPINEYGRHKEAVERFLKSNVPEALILRLDKIISDDIFGKHLLSDWHQRIQENQPIICIEQLCSPTFIKDIAKSIIKGCQCGLSGAYNVANPEYFTRVELARQFALAVGKEVDIILKPHEYFNFADPRLKNSHLDSTRFRKETGINFTSMREVFNSFISKKMEQ